MRKKVVHKLVIGDRVITPSEMLGTVVALAPYSAIVSVRYDELDSEGYSITRSFYSYSLVLEGR